jgi:predicted outer membrane protein
MLVIPALISLKPSVVNEVNSEMQALIDEVTQRLRDPADNVAKTAKKLILELHKCYPETFDKNYVETKTNEDEKVIFRLIMDNNFEEAQNRINQTSPSKRMQM